jgi:hypothetical protein
MTHLRREKKAISLRTCDSVSLLVRTKKEVIAKCLLGTRHVMPDNGFLLPLT